MRRHRAALLLLALPAALSGCQPGPEVARVVSGRDASGRFIDTEAYAVFLEGALAEAHGERANAALKYRRATALDPSSTEAWARLGVARCLDDPREADRALSRARGLGPELSDGFLATAECALERGDLPRAIDAGGRALSLSPDDAETTRVLALSLERAGHGERAERLRRALALRGGRSLAPAPGAREAVSRALSAGNLTRAEQAARAAGWSAEALLVYAIAEGRADLVEPAAARALSSDPGDTGVRIAALVSADLDGKDDLLARFGTPLPADRTEPSAAAAALMEQLLERRAGAEAARVWHAACADAPAPTGPVIPR